MIRARHHWLYEWFFDHFIRVKMTFHFREIKVVSRFEDHQLPVLLIGNHGSWWDGFFGRRVSQHIFDRRFHVMVLEKELAKRKFLSRLGAFSIRKSSRSLIQSLDYASSLLQNPRNLVMIFPQGQLQSVHLRPLKFEAGWHRLLRSPTPFQIVFMATLADYGSKPRPVIWHYLENFSLSTAVSPPDIERAFNDFMDRCYTQQSNNI